MSINTVRKPLAAFAVCGVLASSLMLASPANATEVEPTASAAQVESTTPSETPSTETATPSTPAETSTPAKPAATPVKPTAATPAKQSAKKVETRAKKKKSKYKKAPTLNEVRSGKRVLREGQKGNSVKVLQKRLIDAGYYKLKATGIYGANTTKAVQGIREKTFLASGASANSQVLKKLWGMTGKANRVPSICKKQAAALCASKTQKVLRYYRNGKLIRVYDARFGQIGKTPTRNGNFRVHWKEADGTSDLSGTWMPWAMYFSGGQAVHYSPGFRSVGYYGASLGCINIRDYKGVKWLYSKVKVGTFVKVYK